MMGTPFTITISGTVDPAVVGAARTVLMEALPEFAKHI
jgi:hypothetical protein